MYVCTYVGTYIPYVGIGYLHCWADIRSAYITVDKCTHILVQLLEKTQPCVIANAHACLVTHVYHETCRCLLADTIILVINGHAQLQYQLSCLGAPYMYMYIDICVCMCTN